jgi:hypothetical protein
LIVYSDRKLSGAVAFKCFKPVTRQSRQVSQAGGCVKPVKTHLGLPGKAGKLLDVPSGCKPFGRLAAVADITAEPFSRTYELRK